MNTTIAQTKLAGNALFPEDLATLQANYGASCTRYEDKAERKLSQADTIVVSGYGCSLNVQDDQLIVNYGKVSKDQKLSSYKLSRGVHNVSHIVLVNDKCNISGYSLSWCKDQNISVLLLDSQGNVVSSMTPDCDSDILLREAQFLARFTHRDVLIALELVKTKLQTQINVLRDMATPNCATAIEKIQQILTQVGQLDDTTNQRYLMTLEGRAADYYFECLKGLPIKWNSKVKKSVPENWLTVSQRSSNLSDNGQYATNPFQAILNYAYALLEYQCRRSLNSRGFDVSKGFLHANQQDRDSLVFDLMELFRPLVDALVLKFIDKTAFTKGDLMSDKCGRVVFNPEVSRWIVANCRLPQDQIDGQADVLRRWLLADQVVTL